MKRGEMDAVIARWWRYATVAALALSGLLFVTARERSSVERGNRLHRSGERRPAPPLTFR